MTKNLVLVDFENKQKVDLSALDSSYRAIVFVGANQNPPKAARMKKTAHRFERVDFMKIEGSGRNALDFHIAFQLGRILETEPETSCYVLSGDKGFDPLIAHLTKNSLLQCKRIESLAELHVPATSSMEMLGDKPHIAPGLVVCQHCHKASSIEHHGGQWCTNCGRFASPPNPELLPSRQKGYKDPERKRYEPQSTVTGTCSACSYSGDMSDGFWEEGDWVCGGCRFG
ncbi:MAG: PIN domain-containing protein [Polaromonas sp.]|nr:PIN domain-containing protein [Polaromonas sp.]